MENIKEFNTGKCSGLLVKVPENADGFIISCGKYSNSPLKLVVWGKGLSTSIDMPDLNQYTILGIASDLTEDQCRKVVETVSFSDYIGYNNYMASGRDFRDIVESSFKNAKESFYTFLEKHEATVGRWLVLINKTN
jgi:hypothetical protein